MSLVQPSAWRSRVRRDHGVLHVEIPVRAHPLVIVACLGTILAPVLTVDELLRFPVRSLAFLGPALFDALLMAVATLLLVGMLLGREQLQVSPAGLVIRVEILGRGFTRAYDPSHVTRFRWAPNPSAFWREVAPLMTPPIAFDYGSTRGRLGRGLGEAEAAILVEELAATGAFPHVAAAGPSA